MADITDLKEAIEIMGVTNVITPQQIRDIGLDVVECPLRIPRNILKWNDTEVIERTKCVQNEDIPDILAKHNIKQLYYTPDKNNDIEHDTLHFEQPRWWQFWKDTTKETKTLIWADFVKTRAERVWVVYDEVRKKECPYLLLPGVEIDISTMFTKFSGMICYSNNPLKRDCRADLEEMDGASKEMIARKVSPGWYLVLKKPERKRFIKKSREQQQSQLKYYETWGKTAEALLAGILMRIIHERDILTDYTHCNDWLYKSEGPWTAMIHNSIAYENVPRGNFVLTHNSHFHGHRNTVLFVLINVGECEDV